VSVLYCFSVRCNIYISCLCYDVSVRLSVCLSLTRIVGLDAAGISGGRGEGMEKLVIVTILLNLLTESLDCKQLKVQFCLHMNDVDIYLIL